MKARAKPRFPAVPIISAIGQDTLTQQEFLTRRAVLPR